MAPKKKQQQTMSLGDFLTDSGFGGGSWADEVEETYVTGTQPLPSSDRPRPGGATSSWQDRGYSIRESVPQSIPERPPFTAHLGNLSYDATVESVTDFFAGSEIVSVRIIEDRELQRPKGFGYVEFTDVEGLKKALQLDGESFQGRMIKIKVADPPRGGDSRMDSSRDLSDWTRKGPLPDLPNRGGNRQPSEFGSERRMRDPALESNRGPAREMNWERRGPLAPLPPQEFGGRDGSRPPRPAPEGMGERSESFRGPRPDRPERPERSPTAAEKDFQWRDRMRPDAGKSSPSQEAGEDSAAPAPATAPAPAPAPASRPRLNLQKRTVTESTDAGTPAPDSKASPFGAARPIDTASRERELEVKRQQAIQEKREADEKAKEGRRLAKQAAKEAEAEAEAKAAAAEEEAPAATETKEAEEKEDDAEKQLPVRTREPREPRENKEGAPNLKSRAAEAGNWRSASGEQRGPRGGGRGGRGGASRGGRNDTRGPRANGGSAQQSSAPSEAGDATTVDEDGWTTVPNKKGRQGRP
ncbi:translation initiation factor eIF4B [Cordyceps fumosorosea ARSEF 2679]|uniref:Translation initiation factor eIF4B n=1 Tax=Cordyceps fumosorosea (strain ARSEF 2679) TaxID=1081104 RepID=A0A162LQP3_CORFA|nr:translation initiation factor eIF4B [Cordyceps fumosorosea ARSEF 2679]OAA74194.1 translation initiation factor eIF4B [Cordyceps fumosorosea ARSEF 2679]